MKHSEWLNGLRTALSRALRRPRAGRKPWLASERRVTFELLETRRLLAVDFGDAPDFAPGIGVGNYNTLATDNGPQHTIVVGLRMGANVDGDSGTLQNTTANADDVNGALPDDEDGLVNPAADLVLTVGTSPTVNLRVTNTTGTAAILYGWIDYNANGVFDNGTEWASVAVPNGTNNLIKSLTFPAVPAGATGTTYARFRLSTDAAAANSTGAASDGEVEDYRVEITRPSDGTADSTKTEKLASDTGEGGVPSLPDGRFFGRSVASLGDLDGDGVTDLAVGDSSYGGGNDNTGGMHVLLMNSDGTAKEIQTIHDGNGVALALSDSFGSSVASLGDLDGDGVNDLVVGSPGDDTGGTNGTNRGAVYVFFLNTNGTPKSSQKIAHNTGGGPTLGTQGSFGSSVASIGDLNGDGVTDLAVGVSADDTLGNNRGALYVLFLSANGTVSISQKIAYNTNGGPITITDGDGFGSSVASLGDLDGDGVTDLAVGASGDDTLGNARGAVYVLFLNSNGTVKGSQKIASGTGGAPVLANEDTFGISVASLGDLDGDGVTDLAVGAAGDDTGGFDRGAVHMLFMNPNGTVKGTQKIANGLGGGPTLANQSFFGSSVTSLGDLDGDGVTDLAVGAPEDGGSEVYTLFLNTGNTEPAITSADMANVPENTNAVMTVTAVDLPSQTSTFSIIGGADQTKFDITSGGVLSFISPPDFEMPNDINGDNVYDVTVQADYSEGGMATQTISVVVTPVNDNYPVFTSSDTVNVAENTTAVLTVTATDADLPAQAVTFSLVGGTDQAKFEITSGGVLSFIAAPNFEVPTDANGDNIYVVIVQASDGSLTSLQAILVTVTNGNDGLFADYNLNRVVDAADYTVWRDTLGSTTDLRANGDDTGLSAGVIDEADFLFWRANFGNSLPPESGSGAGAATATSASFADEVGVPAEPDAPAAQSLAAPATTAIPRLTFPAGLAFQTVVSRSSSPRLARRELPAVDASRDQVLAAWLAAKSIGARRELPTVDWVDLLSKPDRPETRGQLENALDLAFASVGVQVGGGQLSVGGRGAVL